MKERTFTTPIFHTSPFAFSATEFWGSPDRQAKELTLTYGLAREHGISRMKLELAKISATDAQGKEHFLEDFPSHVELHPNGMETALYKSLTQSLSLPEGSYISFRFYLARGANVFVFADRREAEIETLEHLDFQIEDGLRITGDTNREVRFRFDLAPFSLSGYFHPLLKLFGKSKTSHGRLAQSFGS